MITIFLTILGGACGALFYRARGGFNPLFVGTQLTRIVFWALPVAVAAGLIAAAHGVALARSLEIAAACGALAFAGLLIPHGFCAGKDNPPGQPWHNLLWMAAVGAARAALIALPLAFVAPWMLALPLFGALAGPAYRHAWRFLSGIDVGPHLWGKVFACSGTEWGEVLTGFALGAGMGLLGSL